MNNNFYSSQLAEASPEDIERIARDCVAQGRILNLLLDIVFRSGGKNSELFAPGPWLAPKDGGAGA